jgi:hypothetical protein
MFNRWRRARRVLSMFPLWYGDSRSKPRVVPQPYQIPTYSEMSRRIDIEFMPYYQFIQYGIHRAKRELRIKGYVPTPVLVNRLVATYWAEETYMRTTYGTTLM